jgi:DNA-binding LacI/PurR family transcriptional regulator
MMPTKVEKTTQYQWLAQQLRKHIHAGELQAGDRLPSWAEMQRVYGVNKYTIERAQKLLAEEGLLVCRQGSGTFVADRLSRPAATRKGILGMSGEGFLNIQSSPYWAQLMFGIEQAARAHGNHLLLLGHDSTDGWEKADGLLVSDQSGELVANKVPAGLPCVSVLTPIDGICSVYPDDAAGIRSAVAHLVQLGHRKIGYFHGAEGVVSHRRIAAYHEAMNAAGLPVDQKWTRAMRGLPQFVYKFDYGARFVETGRDNMADWLRDGWANLGCTALLAHNDEFALGMIEVLEEAGYRIPDDVSIVGFDGNNITARTAHSLSTVEVPLQEIGQRSVEILLQQITTNECSAAHCVLPAPFRAGDTTVHI